MCTLSLARRSSLPSCPPPLPSLSLALCPCPLPRMKARPPPHTWMSCGSSSSSKAMFEGSATKASCLFSTYSLYGLPLASARAAFRDSTCDTQAGGTQAATQHQHRATAADVESAGCSSWVQPQACEQAWRRRDPLPGCTHFGTGQHSQHTCRLGFRPEADTVVPTPCFAKNGLSTTVPYSVLNPNHCAMHSRMNHVQQASTAVRQSAACPPLPPLQLSPSPAQRPPSGGMPGAAWAWRVSAGRPAARQHCPSASAGQQH